MVNIRKSYCYNFIFKVEVFGLEGIIEQKNLHVLLIHFKEIKIPRGHNFLISGIQITLYVFEFCFKEIRLRRKQTRENS